MIRKQVDIDERHEEKLKRLARERGVTEAEIIRDAIEHTENSQLPSQPIPDPEAVRQFFAFVRALENRPAPQWTRDSLYEERIGRWTKS
jgi:hypothetical protein